MSFAWENKQVLVTGAGGFIGSHLVEALVSRGARVRALVRYNSRNDPGLLKQIDRGCFASVEIIPADLRDADAVRNAARQCELIFHLGALISIPYSYDYPTDVVETNVMGTLNVLMAARDGHVQRVVHTSSSEVYGTALRVPMDESHPLQGQSPYSASKIAADKIVESFHCSYGLPVVTLRPFNTYGPRQSARAVIPTMVLQALTGSLVRLGNLEARRDFTYVADTVNGFLKIAEVPGLEGQTVNLGSGEETSISDLAQTIIRLTSRPVEIEVEPARLRPQKSEVRRLLSDNRRARELMNWSPRVPLEEGLGLTIDWIRGHLDLYSPDLYVK